jgi:hypothetical protein
MKQQAKSRFGWLASQIDQGVTPDDYFAPTRDVIARTLEVSPESIDLMDPKWLGLVEVKDDNGQTRGATLNEALLAARRQSQWSDTQNAQEMSASAAGLVKRMFGLG